MSLLKAKIKLQQAQESLNRNLITQEQFDQIRAECEQEPATPPSKSQAVATQTAPSRPRRTKPAAAPELPPATNQSENPDESGNG